jgi:hypothetical protein
MNDLEDRLRAGLATRARQADPALIRPLREPAARARRRMPGWLAPVAAAAAVAAVIIGAGFAVQLPGHDPVAAPATGLPGYYLTLDQPGTGTGHFAQAVVRGSATGTPLARARIPMLGGESPSVTAAADGRTFVVVDNTFESPGHGYGVRIYRLRVGPDGRTVRVDRLPIRTWPLAVDGVALSPDGSKLAIAEQSCPGGSCQYSQIQVRSLADGTTRTWRTRASGLPLALSWAADGSQVGFLWESGVHSPPPRQRDGYRLLSVADAGGALLPAGPVVAVAANPGSDIPAAFVTPDGGAFVTSSTRIVRGQNHHVTVITKVIELPVRGGQAQRVLYEATARGVPQTYGGAGTIDEQGCTVLSLDPAAQHPLVQCFMLGQFRFGVLASGHLKSLPGVPDEYCTSECRGPRWGTAAW